MSDTIGVGVLKTVVDNSGMGPGIAKGVADLKKFEQAAEKAGEGVEEAFNGLREATDEAQKSTTRLDATTKRFLASLTNESERTGLLRSEYLTLRAAKLGVLAQSEQYIAKIRAEEKATDDLRKRAIEAAAATRGLGAAGKTVNEFGMSAKATSAALRNVPAQFTDIIVSLQGGQAPLTVFLQQGGQLKDMFGGASNAARALFGYVTGLITPFTLLATAAAAVSYVYYQGSKEVSEYNKNIIMSGNYAGVTANQLNTMAAGFRDVGITQGAAAETLAAVVGTGRIAAAELDAVTQATINLTKVGGQDMSAALANFVALGEDPVKASQKLNESFNYLTVAVYEQIKALKESGREDEAAALAQRSFANAINDRAKQVSESIGLIERAYKGVISTAKLAWDAMLNVGRDDTFAQKYVAQMDRVAGAKTMSERTKGTYMGDMSAKQYVEEEAKLNEMMRQYNAENAKASKAANDANANKKGIDAVDAVSKLQGQAKGVASVTEELKKYHAQLDAIRKANPNSELLSPENIKKGEDAIRKANQGTQVRQKAHQDNEGQRYLQTLREQGAALEAQLASDEKLTESQKARAKFEQLIADLKTKSVLTADQKSLLANESALRIQLQKNEATESEVVAAKELAKAKKAAEESEKRAYDTFMARITNNALTMGSRQEGRGDEYARNLGAYGQGDAARQQIEAQKGIYKEFERYKLELDKVTPANQLGSDAYASAVAEIQTKLGEAIAAHQEYYSSIKELEADATQGQNQAIANYIDSAGNVARSTAQMWTSGMQQAEDALVEFVKTGKLNFKSLADSIISDMIRIAARQAMSGLLTQLFGAAIGAFGGGWSSAGVQFSGAVTSPVTGGSGAIGTALPPLSEGGFTGYGNKYDPAGIVHRGEVVFSQDDVSRHGGVGAVEAMRKRGGRGFAQGGAVGGSNGSFAGGGSIIIQNMGAPIEAKGSEQKPNAAGGMDLYLMVRQLEGQMASNVQQGTGPMAKAIEARFGSKTAVR